MKLVRARYAKLVLILIELALLGMGFILAGSTWFEARLKTPDVELGVSGNAASGGLVAFMLVLLLTVVVSSFSGGWLLYVLSGAQLLFSILALVYLFLRAGDVRSALRPEITAKTGLSGSGLDGLVSTPSLTVAPLFLAIVLVLLALLALIILFSTRYWKDRARRYARPRNKLAAEAEPIQIWDELSRERDSG